MSDPHSGNPPTTSRLRDASGSGHGLRRRAPERPTSRYPSAASVSPVFLAALLLLIPVGSAAPVGRPASGAPSTPVDVLNVATTSALGYDPNTLTVHPGDNVELIVTQMANFAHTFVLSPLPNFTFDPQASAANLTTFFNAHPPLVNLTLSSTVGSKAFVNFTAPPVGNYEFVCIQPMHFQSGMHGELVSTTSAGAAPNNGPPVAWLLGAGVLIGLVLVAAVFLMVRRKRASPPATP
jgi:plastocyanin